MAVNQHSYSSADAATSTVATEHAINAGGGGGYLTNNPRGEYRPRVTIDGVPMFADHRVERSMRPRLWRVGFRLNGMNMELPATSSGQEAMQQLVQARRDFPEGHSFEVAIWEPVFLVYNADMAAIEPRYLEQT